MELTPEERERIYQEEKARIEAGSRLRREAKQRQSSRTARGCLIAFGVVIVIGMLPMLFRGNKPAPIASPPPAAPPSNTTPVPEPTVRPVSPGELRAQLKENYLAVIKAANPHLNFIKASVSGGKGRYTLWAVHDYFSQFSLSIGDDAKVIQAWIHVHRDELEKANIRRVGLKGTGEYASSSWLELK